LKAAERDFGMAIEGSSITKQVEAIEVEHLP
jgi:hypothetical protein